MNHPGAGPNTNGGAFAGPKRAMPDPYGGFPGPKRVKGPQSNQPGLGGKSKPCAMFFSPSGCQYGDACHFQHYVPGGFNVSAQKPNMGNPVSAPQRIPMGPPGFSQAPPTVVKTRMCNKYITAEGCKFGEKCNYAHGEREMGQPVAAPVTGPAGGTFPGRFQQVRPVTGPAGGKFPGRFQQPQPVTVPAGGTFLGRSQQPQPVTIPAGGTFLGRSQPPQPAAVANFGASATAKFSVDASLAGHIIGKNGANTKQIYHVTGAKIFIKDHESDAAQKNIEVVGTIDQVEHASTMVRQLIINIRATMILPKKNPAGPAPGGPPGNFKTKLCGKFTKGECSYGDRCNFAHGESELRA